MSTAKRSRPRQSEASANSSYPPSKKTKTSTNSSAPPAGLAFLTDESKRAGRKLLATATNGVTGSTLNRVNESDAVISGHGQTDNDMDMKDVSHPETIEISSAESEYELSGDEENDGQDTVLTHEATNGEDEEGYATAGAHKASNGVVDAADAVVDDAGPSFGDLLQASHPDAIDVQAAFADRVAQSHALVPVASDRALEAPSATSLGTVLTQALRTNDKDLLESCFQMNDLASIRSTIQRLQSPLVASLLQRLAERLHKRPGRAGNLMVWVQWSLVAHGGYLAGQPEVMRKLKSLSQVVRERANGLQSLMTLKGKLDMLSAQIELRRNLQAAAGGAQSDSDEEDGVIYVEGDEEASSDEDEAMPIEASAHTRPKNKKSGLKINGRLSKTSEDAEDSSEGEDDMPTINGVVGEMDDESSAGEDEEQPEGFFDDEAEETSDDDGNETSEADDSDDDVEGDEETSASESDEAPPVKQAKPQRRSGLIKKR